MLEVRNVSYRAGGRWILRGVSFHVRRGEVWAVIGANGAGKSTLLRLVSGELSPHSGEVYCMGRALRDYSPVDIARQRACLSQERHTVFPFTTREVVEMGRIPWQAGGKRRTHEATIVTRAMERAGVAHLRERLYPTLSGGEKTRVDLARAMAQEPKVLLLDEPTNHLDGSHQLGLLNWCREQAATGGCVVTVLHDINLASRVADRILLLDAGAVAAIGTPEEVVTDETMRRHFAMDCVIWRHPSGCPWVVPIDTMRRKPAVIDWTCAVGEHEGYENHDCNEVRPSHERFESTMGSSPAPASQHLPV